MNASHALVVAGLQRRTAALADRYTEIACTRMAGMPLLNCALHVEALGFEPMELASHAPHADADPSGEADPATPSALGILLTPWFMNLIHLPLQHVASTHAVGRARTVRLQGRALEFIGAHEPGIGAFAACSLFSPVFEFACQGDAVAMARAVLAELRPKPAMPQPARRSFLFGRFGAAA